MFDYRVSFVSEDIAERSYYGIFHDPVGNGTDWELVSAHETIQDAVEKLLDLDHVAAQTLRIECNDIPF